MIDATYSGFFDELEKIAEEGASESAPSPLIEHPAKTLAKGVGGYALGAGLGYVGAHALNQGIKALGGEGLPAPVLMYGAPVAAAAMSLGGPYLQGRINKRIDAWRASRNAASEGSDGLE